jgi:hypothetical protein
MMDSQPKTCDRISLKELDIRHHPWEADKNMILDSKKKMAGPDGTGGRGFRSLAAGDGGCLDRSNRGTKERKLSFVD